MLGFIALFIVPVFGLRVLLVKKQRDILEIGLDYLSVMVIANLLSYMALFLISGASQSTFTVLFFIKYVALNIIMSVVAALVILTFKNRVSLEIKVKKNVNKK